MEFSIYIQFSRGQQATEFPKTGSEFKLLETFCKNQKNFLMAIFLPECGWTEVITLKIKPKIMTHNSSKEIITFFYT